jgi:hypothetical protein
METPYFEIAFEESELAHDVQFRSDDVIIVRMRDDKTPSGSIRGATEPVALSWLLHDGRQANQVNLVLIPFNTAHPHVLLFELDGSDAKPLDKPVKYWVQFDQLPKTVHDYDPNAQIKGIVFENIPPQAKILAFGVDGYEVHKDDSNEYESAVTVPVDEFVDIFKRGHVMRIAIRKIQSKDDEADVTEELKDRFKDAEAATTWHTQKDIDELEHVYSAIEHWQRDHPQQYEALLAQHPKLGEAHEYLKTLLTAWRTKDSAEQQGLYALVKQKASTVAEEEKLLLEGIGVIWPHVQQSLGGGK